MNCLNQYQFGFKENHSTKIAIDTFFSKVLQMKNFKNYVAALLIDLSKAFDMICHSYLIGKLEHYGIRGNINKFVQSFLSDRELYCNYKNQESTNHFVNSGVPQGCIMSPFLYNIYINDLSNFIVHTSILYADDTTILVPSGK